MLELPASLTGREGQTGSTPGKHRCRGMKWPGQHGATETQEGNPGPCLIPPWAPQGPSQPQPRCPFTSPQARWLHALLTGPGFPWWCLSLLGPQPRPEIKEQLLLFLAQILLKLCLRDLGSLPSYVLLPHPPHTWGLWHLVSTAPTFHSQNKH